MRHFLLFSLFFFPLSGFDHFKQTSIFQFFKSVLNLCRAGLISRIMIVVRKSSLGPDGIRPLSTWFIKANNSKSPLRSTWSRLYCSVKKPCKPSWSQGMTEWETESTSIYTIPQLLWSSSTGIHSHHSQPRSPWHHCFWLLFCFLGNFPNLMVSTFLYHSLLTHP